MSPSRPLFALLLCACSRAAPVPEASLRFLVDGNELRTLSLAELAAKTPPVSVATDDPYYGRTKHFRAVPLEAVLALGFAGSEADGRELVFRAKDGYSVTYRDAVIQAPGAYLAFADEDVAGFEPIGPQRVSPFPLYLIWTKPGQGDLETHPRPWQLQAIERLRFELAYPHLTPPQHADAEQHARAQRGYETFKAQCFQCHAINREGGRTGPELNVPQNVFEYLPADYVRAYIVKPSTFRYGIMPSHETMPSAELDDLLLYLRSMKDRKHDPK